MNKKTLPIFFALSIIVSACGAASEDQLAAASTAAAQTVEARFTEMAEENNTPIPEPSATANTTASEATPEPIAATPTKEPGLGTLPDDALVASLYSETIPDGTVLATGEYFMKSWTILNNGTFTWSKDYKLIYWDGDLLGGYTEYSFFDVAAPGETITFPIQLRAPELASSYTGYWKMKSPSGYIFGVGEYDAPVSVNIDVRNEGDIEYGITSVEYYMTRNPQFGCPANVEWTVHAIVSVSGPMEIRYQFYQRESDGQVVKQKKQWLSFTEAGTKTVSNEWKLNSCVNSNARYVSFVRLNAQTDSPVQPFPEFMFINNCPDLCP